MKITAERYRLVAFGGFCSAGACSHRWELKLSLSLPPGGMVSNVASDKGRRELACTNAKHSFYGEHYPKMPRAPPTAIAVPPPPGGGLKANPPFNHRFLGREASIKMPNSLSSHLWEQAPALRCVILVPLSIRKRTNPF